MQDSLTKIFKAISDPTRREILRALVLASAAIPITQLSTQFDMSRQGVTKHVRTLESAGLIQIESKGRERFCIPDPKPLKEIQNWLLTYEGFWNDSLKNLEDYLGK